MLRNRAVLAGLHQFPEELLGVLLGFNAMAHLAGFGSFRRLLRFRQACGELAQRLKGAGVDGATCLTFHAFALTVLRRFGDATERTAVKLSAARERGSNESTKNRAML